MTAEGSEAAPAAAAVERDGRITIIAGPCSIESREQMMEVAAACAESGVRVMRGGAYKPRTSPYSFQGMEEEGLKLLAEAAEAYGLLTVTEVTDSAHAEIVDAYVDILQVGTRNMANFSLLKKLGAVTGESGKPVLFKRGMAATIEEWLQASEYLTMFGNPNVILCERGIVLIDTTGEAVGQINGLAVLQAGYLAFGKPSRITARVRMGTGKLVDIEREVALGGPLHSKGVLILSGFLAARYALDAPLSLSATLVFEQSYGGVDGDSASSTELYALLSALSELPIRQGLAVTGSVNQHGEVQAIGGVNEKIEGFFDICAARGLTGEQGVLIPAANVKHLMLRKDVVEACGEGRFKVLAVSHIDEGIELLTGTEAGARGPDGRFPDGTVNRLVEDRLAGFAEARRRFGKTADT